ncbi:pilus assembly protein PilS [Neisseria gonorrhoeae]
MPSEPSDGIFDAPAVYRRGAGAVKYPNRHPRQHRNLETRPTTPQSRNPSFPTIPQSRNPSFPRRRESRSVSAGTYRAKRFLEILSPGFPLSRE